MTETEKNNKVLFELFGDKEFSEDIVENRLTDWDKAWTCINYNKQSDAFKAKGENVYANIYESNAEFLKSFKAAILKMEESL